MALLGEQRFHDPLAVPDGVAGSMTQKRRRPVGAPANAGRGAGDQVRRIGELIIRPGKAGVARGLELHRLGRGEDIVPRARGGAKTGQVCRRDERLPGQVAAPFSYARADR